MGDEDDRNPELISHGSHKVFQIGACLCIHGCEWLVHQQKLRLIRQCSRDRDPLLHPARQLPGIAFAKPREIDRLKAFCHASATFIRRDGLVPKGKLDVSVHRCPRKQGAAVLLKDHGEAGWHASYDLTLKPDRSARGAQKSGKGLEQRGLAAARGADDRDDFARLDRKADTGRDDLPRCVSVMQAFDREHNRTTTTSRFDRARPGASPARDLQA